MRRAALFLVLAAASLCRAEVKLHPLFTDHMVLQRGTNCPVWGWASPGEKITVIGSWRAQAFATAGPDGKWFTKIKTNPAAGGPHTLTVRGENTVTVNDVLLGEVWLCSGQSNMEWPGRLVFSKAPAGADKGEGNPRIRYFNVPNKRSLTPQETVEAKWEISTPVTAPHHSAVGYYFARTLQSQIPDVPVGLIESDWGGTEVEVWIREGALRTLPGFDRRIDEVKAAAGGANSLQDWIKRREAMEKGMGVYEKPAFDDSSWEPAKLGPWESNGMPDFDGYVWYRARFDLDIAYAGLPLQLELGEIDDEDITFVNGKRVGGMTVWNAKRVYKINADDLNSGPNVIAIRVLDTGGGGGLTTPNEIRLQVGDHEIKPTWKWKASVNLKDTNPPAPTRWPAADLYNGMIAPIIPYAIKGALWYQGESNVGRAYQYRQTFPLLIKNWREDFAQGDIPFFFVQLAPWSGYGGGGASAELREAQLLTLGLKNTGMAVTTDITDDIADIHPVNKWDVGRRLGLLALNRVYRKRQVDSGPVYKSHRVEGDKIRVTFESAGQNLMMRGGNLPDLMIAGADRKFVPARVRMDGASIIVWSENVPKPVAVRYGWSDTPQPGLFNSAGLPASPFRTDTWPGVTEKAGW